LDSATVALVTVVMATISLCRGCIPEAGSDWWSCWDLGRPGHSWPGTRCFKLAFGWSLL